MSKLSHSRREALSSLGRPQKAGSNALESLEVPGEEVIDRVQEEILALASSSVDKEGGDDFLSIYRVSEVLESIPY